MQKKWLDNNDLPASKKDGELPSSYTHGASIHRGCKGLRQQKRQTTVLDSYLSDFVGDTPVPNM